MNVTKADNNLKNQISNAQREGETTCHTRMHNLLFNENVHSSPRFNFPLFFPPHRPNFATPSMSRVPDNIVPADD